MKFNPEKVAKYEYESWKAHHEDKKLKLLFNLFMHHISFYSVGPLTSIKMIKHLAKAIRAHNRKHWKESELQIEYYYDLVKSRKDFKYDSKKVAKLEVGWWKIHDELEDQVDKSSLTKQFIKLYSTILGQRESVVQQACEYRTTATINHDKAESKNTDNKQRNHYWEKAHENLIDFYREVLLILNK